MWELNRGALHSSQRTFFVEVGSKSKQSRSHQEKKLSGAAVKTPVDLCQSDEDGVERQTYPNRRGASELHELRRRGPSFGGMIGEKISNFAHHRVQLSNACPASFS